MDGKIDAVREALNELQGLIHHIERTTGHEYDSRKLHAALAALSAVDPDAIRRECARAARNAIFDFGIGNKASNYYSPTIRRDLAVQLVERAILSAEPAPASTPWSRFEIGMLAAMMTGNLDKDTATLTGYLAADPAQDGSQLKCDLCGNVETPPYAEGDACYCGGEFKPAQDDGKTEDER